MAGVRRERFVLRSAVVSWAMAGLAGTVTTGCRADPKDQPSSQAEAVPIAARRLGPPENERVTSTTESTESTESTDDPAQSPHPELVEIRRSNIPSAGDGLFAKVDIPASTYLGDYQGRYLTDEQLHTLSEYESAYVFELSKCTDPAYDNIAGDPQHYVSKANFAPSELNGEATFLQNAEWWTFCDEPYVRLYSARDIAANEELYIDYGPSYDYEFMEFPQVQEFFLAVIEGSFEDGFVFEYSSRL